MICENCGAVIPEGAAFCDNCGMAQKKEPGIGTPRTADPAVRAAMSAPPTAKKRASQPADKTTRRLQLASLACGLLGFLFSQMASSAQNAGPSGYTHAAIDELSRTIATYNVLAIIMFLAMGVLGIILFIRNKKNKDKQ